MGILERFADILKANVNDLLDKCEDPAKMIDQYLRDLSEQLADVKWETAGVMAEESRTKRLLDENTADTERFGGLAKKALAAGNEGDARVFLQKKQELEAKNASLQTTYAAAHDSAQKMRQMHDKLVDDISALNGRREMIKAKVAVAKTQQKVNEFTSSADKAAGVMSSFDRMEQKANNMFDRANAMSELNTQPVDDAKKLEDKYGAASSASVDDELARLKMEMGLV